MDGLINNIGAVGAAIIEGFASGGMVLTGTAFWATLAVLFVLLGLFMVWLLIRLRRARLSKITQADPQLTFDDVSADAAAQQPSRAAAPAMMSEKADKPISQAASPVPAASAGNEAVGENQPTGFRFFKRKAKTIGEAPVSEDMGSNGSADDDVYLLGLEQEMLATRQLYLDGLITKEVYITETRALYDKAQSRMT